MLFEADEAITERVDKLFAVCADMARGDVLANATIEEVVGCPPHQGCWKTVVRRLKRRMERERGITLWPIAGVGQELATVFGQLAELPKKRRLMATRHIAKAVKSVKAVRQREMTSFERRKRLFQVELLEAENHRLRGDMIRDRIFGQPRS